jgi:hypothetical protein
VLLTIWIAIPKSYPFLMLSTTKCRQKETTRNPSHYIAHHHIQNHFCLSTLSIIFQTKLHLYKNTISTIVESDRIASRIPSVAVHCVNIINNIMINIIIPHLQVYYICKVLRVRMMISNFLIRKFHVCKFVDRIPD